MFAKLIEMAIRSIRRVMHEQQPNEHAKQKFANEIKFRLTPKSL